ncbi:MAG: hypothetical protein LC647_16540 [Beggiatoa sp.]|nr:hypothetical protein [Beggiatoa sp.]
MNWSYLGAILPQGIEIIDFYHACEHLKAAFDAAYGENNSRSKAQFEKYRHLLRDEGDGVEKVIRALIVLQRDFLEFTLLTAHSVPSIGASPV